MDGRPGTSRCLHLVASMRGPVPAPLGVVYIDRVDLLGGVCRSVGGGICSPVGWRSSSSRLQRRRDGYRCTLYAPSYSSESLGPFGAGAKRSEGQRLVSRLASRLIGGCRVRFHCAAVLRGGSGATSRFHYGSQLTGGLRVGYPRGARRCCCRVGPSGSSESGKLPELAYAVYEANRPFAA